MSLSGVLQSMLYVLLSFGSMFLGLAIGRPRGDSVGACFFFFGAILFVFFLALSGVFETYGIL